MHQRLLHMRDGQEQDGLRVASTRDREVYSRRTPSYFEIVTLSKSPIKTIRDLEGKRVHMSMPGGTPDIAMRYSLETLGIKPKEEVYMQTGNAADLLKDGRLDVVIAVMGLPTSFILDLQSTHDIRLVDIDPEDQTTVAEKYPYFAKGTIPKNTYQESKYRYKQLRLLELCHRRQGSS